MRHYSSRLLMTVFLAVGISLSVSCILFKEDRPVPDKLQQRIKSLCEQYPPPADFVPLDQPKSITKSDRGTYGGWYTSFTNSRNVIAHYNKLLENQNWVVNEYVSYNISGGRQTKFVDFEKDGFNIALEFSDDINTPEGKERTYGLNCGFSP